MSAKRVYREHQDRLWFLELLGLTIGRHGWLCHGYCLMGNHYHLIVETPGANLAAGMKQLNSRYAQSFNRRWGRVGHLFQGRYQAALVEKEAYLLTLARYVSGRLARAVRTVALEQLSGACRPRAAAGVAFKRLAARPIRGRATTGTGGCSTRSWP
jgi:REP element-mobilizing transposase RayT